MVSDNLIPAKPGEIRNPNGRPVGSKNRSKIINDILEAKAFQAYAKSIGSDITDSEFPCLTVADQIGMTLVLKALSGDVPAIKEVMDSAFGKVTDKLDQTLSNPDGTPINTSFTIEVKK